MKVLLDSCVWGPSAADLTAAGHDVRWAGDWPDDPGDAAIMADAHAEHRVVVTLDKDFGELAVLHGLPHCGIVRLVGIPARQQGPVCAEVLSRYADELLQGALVTVDGRRVRIRLHGV